MDHGSQVSQPFECGFAFGDGIGRQFLDERSCQAALVFVERPYPRIEILSDEPIASHLRLHLARQRLVRIIHFLDDLGILAEVRGEVRNDERRGIFAREDALGKAAHVDQDHLEVSGAGELDPEDERAPFVGSGKFIHGSIDGQFPLGGRVREARKTQTTQA